MGADHRNGYGFQKDRYEQAKAIQNAYVARAYDLLREDSVLQNLNQQLQAAGFELYKSFDCQLIIAPTSGEFEKAKKYMDWMKTRIQSVLQSDPFLRHIVEEAEKEGVAAYWQVRPDARYRLRPYVRDGKIDPRTFNDEDAKFLKSFRILTDKKEDPPQLTE